MEYLEIKKHENILDAHVKWDILHNLCDEMYE